MIIIIIILIIIIISHKNYPEKGKWLNNVFVRYK
jgi:putative effector of murein hydrolase